MVLALAEISLEASRPESNLFRAYRISVGRDLFGEWTVATVYGRIGCEGRERVAQCATLAQAKRLVATALRQRMSAPRRIGCAYRLVRLVDAPEIVLADTLPQPLLMRLNAAGASLGDAAGAGVEP